MTKRYLERFLPVAWIYRGQYVRPWKFVRQSAMRVSRNWPGWWNVFLLMVAVVAYCSIMGLALADLLDDFGSRTTCPNLLLKLTWKAWCLL